jgi:hypothetical protein
LENIVTVRDNFISKDFHKIIYENMCLESNFPWFFNQTIDNDNDKREISKVQFTHHFYRFEIGWTDSAYNSILDPILEKLNAKTILRIKANLLPPTQTIRENQLHLDVDEVCKTAIYYVNTNNGYTFFKNSTRVNSIENRLVLFDSQVYHGGTTCTDAKCRVVINFNFN